MRKHKILLSVTIILLGLLLLGWLIASVIKQVGSVSFTNTPAAMVLFVLVVIGEVVLAPIPGGVLGYLGAATFGFWTSWPLHYIGNIIGSIIAFSLARTLGKPFADKLMTEKQQLRTEKLLHGHRWKLYAIYAIPIFPIDMISIVAGLTPMRLRTFLIIMSTGLITYTGIVAFIGARFQKIIPYIEWVSTALFIVFLLVAAWFVWKLFVRKQVILGLRK